MDIKQAFSLVKKDLEKVERSFRKYTLSEVSLATRISNYVLSSGGKRIRPSLFLLITKMCGYSKAEMYPVACAIELLHTATLLHDDVVDSATLRRGSKSANAVWGNKASVLVGDFVHAQVFNILVATKNQEILDLFTKTTVDLVNGEIFQLLKEKDTSMTQDEYFYIIKNKTAGLMSTGAAAAGILAERDQREIKALKSFGMNLGMAFQIIDDALDYVADEKDLGKSVLADFNEGKFTLPIIHILDNGTVMDKSYLKKVLKNEKHTQKDIALVLTLIEKYDSINYVRDIGEKYISKAIKQLKIFPETKEKEALIAIADHIINRNH